MVTAEEGHPLTKEGNLYMSEYIGLNDPLVQINLNIPNIIKENFVLNRHCGPKKALHLKL